MSQSEVITIYYLFHLSGFRCFMSLNDKIIEIVNDEFKNICQIEHSRHSVANFLSNMMAGMIAYHFLPKKPAIKYEVINNNQLTLF